jgi:hypothetical protein
MRTSKVWFGGAVLAATAAVVAAATGWQNVGVLGGLSGPTYGGSARIAQNATGAGVAVWIHNPGGAWRAKAARFDGTTWTSAVLVDADPPDGGMDATYPRVACAPGGPRDRGVPQVVPGRDRPVGEHACGRHLGHPPQPVRGGRLDQPLRRDGHDGQGLRDVRRRLDGDGCALRRDVVLRGRDDRRRVAGTTTGAWTAAGPAGKAVAVFHHDDLSNIGVKRAEYLSGGVAPGPVPSISRVAGVVAPGNVLAVKGRNFGKAEGTVTVGGAAAVVQKWTTTQVTFVAPMGSGTAEVKLTTALGLEAASTAAFVAPTLKSVRAAKPKNGVTTVTIKGKGFGEIDHGATSTAVVDGAAHGASDAAVVKWTDDLIKLRLTLAPGQKFAHVITSAGMTQPTPFQVK